eukprot:COSAG06_NODE_5039_length_3769_cov_2.163488_1_plen_78_part_10
MKPFCVTANSSYRFHMAAANDRETTGTDDNFGCLTARHPGEQWLFMSVATDGVIEIQTSSRDDHDVAVWGPYASHHAA